MKRYAIADKIDGEDIRRARTMLKMTQQEAAEFFGVSKKTIERWESGRGEITGPIVPLVRILMEQPRLPGQFAIPKREYPLRLWYLHRGEACTLIDVDESRQLVRIRNYTDRLQYRAFGVNQNPGYAEYLEFLESRCFPRERDKMKLMLRDLDIPFYDPLLIIEKTQGKMEDDEFSLVIDRGRSGD